MIQRIPKSYTKETRFITDWTVGVGESITLPLVTGYTYNFTVDWGDGSTNTITAYDDSNRIHTYVLAKTYRVIIEGTCQTWNFNAVPTSKDKLNKIVCLGDVEWTSCSNSFAYCSELTEWVSGGEYLGNVTNFEQMFRSCFYLDLLPPVMNLKNGTNFNWMFRYDWRLISLPVIMNVSNGTSFRGMLQSVKMTQLPTIFDVSNGTLFTDIFTNCSNLSSGTLQGCKEDISIENCNFDGDGLNAFYTDLATVTGKTITVTGNPGVGNDDPTIATAKGWTVVSS